MGASARKRQPGLASNYSVHTGAKVPACVRGFGNHSTVELPDKCDEAFADVLGAGTI